MKKILSLGTLLFSANLYAAGGFTWISTIQNLFGTHIAEYIITYSFVGLVLIAIGLLYRTRMAKVPNAVIPDKGITLRNLSELYGQFIYSQCKAVIGEKEADKYFGFISTIFIVILFFFSVVILFLTHFSFVFLLLQQNLARAQMICRKFRERKDNQVRT